MDQVKVVIGTEVNGLDKIGTVNKELSTIKDTSKSVQDSMANIAIPLASIYSVYQFGSAVKSMVQDSLGYLSTLESAQLGIAAAYMTGGQYIDNTTGKVLVGRQALDAAQQDSIKTMQELQYANLQTTATLDQLVKAYQETLPVAMSKGFNRDQAKDFTVAMVQAASAIGLPFDQMGEETRSLLTGSINPRNSRIATVLGLRNQDLEPMKGNANELFNFLMDKLKSYEVAGTAAQHTWDGLWSNTKDIALKAGGDAFQPLFDTVKYELEEITGKIVIIDQTTKKITWNQDFLDGINTVKSGITATIAEAYRFSMLIDKAGGTMTTIGSVMLKTAEVATRFMTIGQFGGTFKGGADAMNRWNKEFETRYQESDKALQALANREVGLDANGKPIKNSSDSRYNPNPPAGDGEDKAADRLYQRYTMALDGLNKQIEMGNPYLTDQEKALAGVRATVAKLIDQMPEYTASWKEAGAALEHNINLAKDFAAQKAYLDSVGNADKFTKKKQEEGWGILAAEQAKKDEDQYNFESHLADDSISTSINLKKLQLQQKTPGSENGMAMVQVEAEQRRQAIENEHAKDLADAERFGTDKLQVEINYRNKILAVDMDTAAKRKAIEKQVNDQKIQMQEGAVNAGIGLLNVFAGKSKAAAMASLILEKGMNIANTYMSTQTASMLAYASQVIPGDPTSVVRAEAARDYTLAMGYTTMGLIAATGIAQAAMSGGGGGSYGGGTPSSPVVTQPTYNQTPVQGAVTVQIHGNMIGEDRWVEENLIPAINAAAGRNVTINVGPQ